jgi:hypothetical protein
MKTTLVALALIATTGIGGAVYAQTTQPGTPPSAPSMPGGTTTPGGTPGSPRAPTTGMPTTKPIAGEAAAKAALEAKGYTKVKQLRRDNAGNWTGMAMRNNSEVAVVLDKTGNIREQ